MHSIKLWRKYLNIAGHKTNIYRAPKLLIQPIQLPYIDHSIKIFNLKKKPYESL